MRSVVVDGVVPPQSVILNEFWPDAAAGYETLIKACEAQSACNAAYPKLRQELIDAVNWTEILLLSPCRPRTRSRCSLRWPYRPTTR